MNVRVKDNCPSEYRGLPGRVTTKRPGLPGCVIIKIIGHHPMQFHWSWLTLQPLT